VPRRVGRENIKELLAKKREMLLVQVCGVGLCHVPCMQGWAHVLVLTR
jgi:hypothetical protein